MADADKEKEKEDIGTRVVYGVATMAAAFVTRKLLIVAWTKATGKKPPTNPEDPGVAFVEALTWSVLTGVTVATLRLLATRAVARRALDNADRVLALTATRECGQWSACGLSLSSTRLPSPN